MPAKTVAIVQSCYVPWKGYFDLIAAVDEFVLFDDRQFTKRDWRNRNRIKTAQGTRWLTIPVRVKGRYHQRIDETETEGQQWRETHLRTILHAYAGAARVRELRPFLEELYLGSSETSLSLVNRAFLEAVCSFLEIPTRLTWSTDYAAEGDRTERLVALCRAAGADAYLSGPRARAYLDESLFAAAGIEVRYADYAGYLEYPQVHPPFEHEVSVLDLLLCTGTAARSYLKTPVAVPRPGA